MWKSGMQMDLVQDWLLGPSLRGGNCRNGLSGVGSGDDVI